jgi:hypothetical protein
MADTVQTTWIYPPNWDGHVRREDEVGGQFGNRRMIVKLSKMSGGADVETDVVKVARADLWAWPGNPCKKIRIDKIDFFTYGLSATLEWDMTPQQKIATLAQDSSGVLEGPFLPSMGEDANYASGETGDILLTTLGDAAGDTYEIILHLTVKG